VGLVGGFSEGLPSLIKLFSGCWSDRMGRRKPLVVGGYALSALASFSWLPQKAGWPSFWRKAWKGAAKACDPASRRHDLRVRGACGRGRGFGLHRAMDSTGAVIGSLLAYSLWQMGFSYSSIFLVAGVLALLALLPFTKVKESYSAPKCEYSWRLSDIPPELLRFLAIACLFALGNFSYMFFILRAQGIFSGAQATASALLLYALFNSTYALLACRRGSGPTAWAEKMFWRWDMASSP